MTAHNPELREVVARALMTHHDIDPDVFFGMHKGYGHWLEAADAAIAAMQAHLVRTPAEPDVLRERIAKLEAIIRVYMNVHGVLVDSDRQKLRDALAATEPKEVM